MAKESLTPQQTFVNQQRKDAARWIYEIVEYEGTKRGFAKDKINQLAAAGWEVFMISSTMVLLRRDATGAIHEEEGRERAGLLEAIGRLGKTQ